ncbi:MAG: hypothetical protein HY054_13900 [Proteobacteria bacterium]|nr:hypothetical protein [Pseudomonadota bacterium]
MNAPVSRALLCWLLTSLVFSDLALAHPVRGGDLDPRRAAWFYNRPGASAAERDQAQRACGELVQNLSVSERYNPNFFGEMMLEGLASGRAAGFVDGCMIWKGFRRIDVANQTQAEFNARLAQMDEGEREALAGAQTPPVGVIGRVWANDFWSGRGDEHVSQPNLNQDVEAAGNIDFLVIDPLRRNAPFAVPLDHAIVVISLRRLGDMRGEHSVIFRRIDAESGRPAPVHVNGYFGSQEREPIFAARAFWGSGAAANSAGEFPRKYLAFSVPAGTYALDEQFSPRGVTQYCFSTIVVRVEPGKVLHLGDITLSTEEQNADRSSSTSIPTFRIDAPDLSAARASGVLPGNLVDQVEAGVWHNGRAACSYELPDFLDGVQLPDNISRGDN